MGWGKAGGSRRQQASGATDRVCQVSTHLAGMSWCCSIGPGLVVVCGDRPRAASKLNQGCCMVGLVCDAPHAAGVGPYAQAHRNNGATSSVYFTDVSNHTVQVAIVHLPHSLSLNPSHIWHSLLWSSYIHISHITPPEIDV